MGINLKKTSDEEIKKTGSKINLSKTSPEKADSQRKEAGVKKTDEQIKTTVSTGQSYSTASESRKKGIGKWIIAVLLLMVVVVIIAMLSGKSDKSDIVTTEKKTDQKDVKSSTSQNIEESEANKNTKPGDKNTNVETKNDNNISSPTNKPDNTGTKEYLTNDELNSVANFVSGSIKLTSESKANLKKLAKQLKENTNQKVDLTGHTDNIGPNDLNQRLSENRAKVVYDYLISLGVEPGRLKTKGVGPSSPITNNDTYEGRSKNRRVSITIK